MNFVLVGGVNYYYDVATVPKFVTHKMNYLVGRFGSDLDAGCPPVIRHWAIRNMTRYGALDF